MRQADELSITVVPASANLGASFLEVLPPAENIAISGAREIASSALITLWPLFLKLTVFPTDLSEATGMNSETGKFFSSSILSISLPTNPVAPTTATFM
jgi:hypothetical protein